MSLPLLDPTHPYGDGVLRTLLLTDTPVRWTITYLESQR